jgi:hypothetical protein
MTEFIVTDDFLRGLPHRRLQKTDQPATYQEYGHTVYRVCQSDPDVSKGLRAFIHLADGNVVSLWRNGPLLTSYSTIPDFYIDGTSWTGPVMWQREVARFAKTLVKNEVAA